MYVVLVLFGRHCRHDRELCRRPFTNNWTMRISRASQIIHVSADASKVQCQHGKNILVTIQDGLNVTMVVSIASHETYTKQNSCFYVVISVEGVSAPHAAFRVISKGGSVAFFAFSTTLFALASLQSVSVNLMVLSLVLSAGVFGRVTAMWIAYQMNETSDPIFHTVGAERMEAARHVEQTLRLEGLIIEFGGHIIVDGGAIKAQYQLLSWSRYIGLLAAPFDVTKMAISRPGEGRG